MKYLYLSYPLAIGGPRPPAIPAPSLEEFMKVEKDGASVHKLSVFSHTGSHLDTSAHVFGDGEYIEDFTPEELIFTAPVVVDLPLKERSVVCPGDLAPFKGQISGADMLLLRFGYGTMRSEEPGRFCTDCPGFGREAAAYLRESFPGLRCVGIDVPSFAAISDLEHTMTAHNVFLTGRHMLIIEEMKLDADLSGLKEVRINPWLVTGMHSGPCSVIGVIK